MLKATKKPKPKYDPSLDDLLTRLKDAEAELQRFRYENAAVLDTYEQLKNGVEQLREEIKYELKKAVNDVGESLEVRAGHVRFLCHVREGRREVDAEKLLKDHPELATWRGLLSVKVSEFDRLYASRAYAAEELDSYVERGEPTKSVTIQTDA